MSSTFTIKYIKNYIIPSRSGLWRCVVIETARISETLVSFRNTTWRHKPEEFHLNLHRRENLKSDLYNGVSKSFRTAA
jgi:hypothetical protein